MPAPSDTAERMKTILREAFAHPDRGGVFYSGNRAMPNSERLKKIPFWDWTPVQTHGVEGVSTCFFPLALGCKPKYTSEGKLWIERLITDPAQVREIVVPDIHAGGPGEVLRRAAELARTIPPGDMIRIPDTQSPLGVAELMWDESFYVALREDPAAVHALLDKITRFIIAFVKEFQRTVGPRLNPCGFPPVWCDGPGTMVADDTMSLVSPEMHLEFSVPYLNRMADECGPLYYHSCSWREAHLPNIHRIRKVRSLNWNPGNSIDPSILMKEFGGQTLIAPHLVIDMHQDPDSLKHRVKYTDEFDFFKYQVESAPKNAALYFWFSNIRDKGDIMERIYDYLDARGHTPAAHGLG